MTPAEQMARDEGWHLDPRAVRKVIMWIVGALFSQTVALLGTGLWWASGIEARQDANYNRIAEHSAQIAQLGTSGERLARLEAMITRMEKVVDRLDDKVERQQKNGYR